MRIYLRVNQFYNAESSFRATITCAGPHTQLVRNGNFVINTCHAVGGGLTTTPTVQINLQEPEFSRPSAVVLLLLALSTAGLSTTGIVVDWSTVVRGLRRGDDGRYNWTSLDSAHKKADWTKQEKRDPAKSEFPLFYQARSKNS